jgi:hypothetical protein
MAEETPRPPSSGSVDEGGGAENSGALPNGEPSASASVRELVTDMAKTVATEIGSAASDEAKDLGLAATRKAGELGERRRQRRAAKSTTEKPPASARPHTLGSRTAGSRSGGPGGRAREVSSSPARGAAKNVILPAATAALGAAAGVLVERRHRRPRKVLGIPIPGIGNGTDLARHIRRAGEQFGHLASEVRSTRKKAENIGKAIS